MYVCSNVCIANVRPTPSGWRDRPTPRPPLHFCPRTATHQISQRPSYDYAPQKFLETPSYDYSLADVDDMVRKSHGRDREDIALASLRWQRV